VLDLAAKIGLGRMEYILDGGGQADVRSLET
jgi:hypothetical protein